MKFRALLQQTGKNTTGFEIPEEVMAGLGKGKKPPVQVTINGYTYRNTVAVMGGVYMLGVSAEHREGACVKGGDELEIDIELDTEPRVVSVPVDLARAIDAHPAAKQFFEGLSYSNKLRHVLSVEGAKTEETRKRRIEKSVALFREGKS